MRRWLILLALAFPVVLMSPAFWVLVGMAFGTTEVVYGYHDGTRQRALLGPKAPWPDWATRPDGTRLTVSAWFEHTPTRPGSGHGDFEIAGDARAAALAYAAKLRSQGWQVESTLFRSATPSIPPRPLQICTINAHRGEGDPRILHAGFHFEPATSSGSLHWADGPMPGWVRHSVEAC